MTYEQVAALTLGSKIKNKLGGPAARVTQMTENFVRLEWYGGRCYDIINNKSPLWAWWELVE